MFRHPGACRFVRGGVGVCLCAFSFVSRSRVSLSPYNCNIDTSEPNILTTLIIFVRTTHGMSAMAALNVKSPG